MLLGVNIRLCAKGVQLQVGSHYQPQLRGMLVLLDLIYF